jgi:hypothetical protein
VFELELAAGCWLFLNIGTVTPVCFESEFWARDGWVGLLIVQLGLLSVTEHGF